MAHVVVLHVQTTQLAQALLRSHGRSQCETPRCKMLRLELVIVCKLGPQSASRSVELSNSHIYRRGKTDPPGVRESEEALVNKCTSIKPSGDALVNLKQRTS